MPFLSVGNGTFNIAAPVNGSFSKQGFSGEKSRLDLIFARSPSFFRGLAQSSPILGPDALLYGRDVHIHCGPGARLRHFPISGFKCFQTLFREVVGRLPVKPPCGQIIKHTTLSGNIAYPPATRTNCFCAAGFLNQYCQTIEQRISIVHER
ncbi:MAG: hypothetical protein EOS32_30325 [Mesorhizobium sp.]|uniref:hypothetical protein n=1 Tax=Mesorhizobium sp. TaxID=1871066 RepID=UPI000FE6D051|nr:hypothetical protein [Mesorhizobium sp.]RWC88572.1 MAG: hypothetical protein EOS32_30325 [Mesorhizobium sp.]